MSIDKKKLFSGLFVLICFFFISACGFHLRTPQPLPASLRTLTVNTPDPYDPFTIDLTQLLKTAGVQIRDTDTANHLRVKTLDFSSSVLSESASASTKQYSLTLTVNYILTDPQEKILYGPKNITIRRNYTVNENQVLSSDSQQITLEAEMKRDAAFTLVLQLSMIGKQVTQKQ